MNVPESDKWVDGLTPSGRPVPEPPAAFLAAVRQRRVRRRMGRAASAAGMLVAASAVAWLLPRPSPAPVPQVASNDAMPPITRPIPRPEPVRTAVQDAPAISLAAYYTEGRPLDSDHLPAAEASDARPERTLRGGDRWDPEKVQSWLQN